jgi:hypothetical protein
MKIPTIAQTDAAFAACRSIRFAVLNADRHAGEFNLNDILAANRLACEALQCGPAKPAKKAKRIRAA